MRRPPGAAGTGGEAGADRAQRLEPGEADRQRGLFQQRGGLVEGQPSPGGELAEGDRGDVERVVAFTLGGASEVVEMPVDRGVQVGAGPAGRQIDGDRALRRQGGGGEACGEPAGKVGDRQVTGDRVGAARDGAPTATT